MPSNFELLRTEFAAEVKTLTRRPHSAAMHHAYRREFRISFAVGFIDFNAGPLVGRCLKLRTLYVSHKHRGHGFGTQLLDLVIRAADQARVTLYLRPDSFGTGARLNDADLTAWYARRGFHPVKGKGRWSWFMVRRPVRAEKAQKAA